MGVASGSRTPWKRAGAHPCNGGPSRRLRTILRCNHGRGALRNPPWLIVFVVQILRNLVRMISIVGKRFSMPPWRCTDRRRSEHEFQERHKERMAWIPPLYFKRRPRERFHRPRAWPWARQWQAEIHKRFMDFEEVK